MPARSDSDNVNIQIGIYRALDWQTVDIAEVLGVSVQAVDKRVRVHGPRIAEVQSWASTAKAKHLERFTRDLEAKADIKARIHKKAYRVVEKTLDHGLQEPETVITPDGQVIEREGVEVNAIHLKAADMAIERVEGKALDRKEIVAQNSLTVTHEIDPTTLLAAVQQMERLNAMRKTAYALPPADVKEAELVDDPTN